MLRAPVIITFAAAALAGCDRQATPNCGITHVAGATFLLQQFGEPDQTLSGVPPTLPERLVARLAAGPAYPAIVGRVDSLLALGVEGTLPPGVNLGYGVLVMGEDGAARGVVLYEGDPIQGAPSLGSVTMGTAEKPLIAVQAPAASYEDASCPFFPDSILR
ncbi:MAG: hypothetical protein ACREMH_10500 [Gemmatimonadales bacterium]